MNESVEILGILGWNSAFLCLENVKALQQPLEGLMELT